MQHSTGMLAAPSGLLLPFLQQGAQSYFNNWLLRDAQIWQKLLWGKV